MRLSCLLRAALLASTAILPAMATARQAGVAVPAAAAAPNNWQNAGGDIAVDPAWRQGTLPNGLRYAVRRSSQPASAISVRVRIGAGALMESDPQQGWSHLLEHMVFRGTAHYGDGEGIKVWQRLGATFGSDTNAATTLSATTFQLDLPHADPASYGQAMAVLADMMDTARIDPALLGTERKVVEAELAQRLSPLVRKIKDAQQPLFLAGTKAAVRDVIGTPETLANADAATLKAYYETWYRPDNAVVVVVGDADPAVLEQGVVRAFSGWTASGPKPAMPDWGTPSQPKTPAATVSDAQAPDTLVLSFVAPHPDGPFTVARQQQQYAELVAVGILNQRLAAAARKDAAIINAGVQRAEQRHIEDQLVVQVQPKPGQWKAALDQAYAVLNGAVANAPAQAEIDQQTAAITTYLGQQVASATTMTAPTLATGFVTDVDNGDVTGPPGFYASLFATGRAAMTPQAIHATIKRLLAPPPRLLVLGPQPIDGGAAAAGAALATAMKVAGGASATGRNVSLDQLVLPGKSGTAGAPTAIARLDATRVLYADGVELVFKRTAFEQGRVRVRVEVGGGLLGEPRDQPGLWWTAPSLPAGGIGPFAAEDLSHALAGHQYGFTVAPALRGLALTGATSASDLAGMLKLMTGEIVAPRFDAATVNRVREATLANYASIFSQPLGVLQAFGGAPLHGGDARFDALPRQDAIARLTLSAFQRFWTDRLTHGPVRVTIVGDVDPAVAMAAVAATLATLPPRTSGTAVNADVQASTPVAPAILHHRGDPNQALVARAWATPGSADDRATGTALDIAASVIQTGLTEGFRATEGGSYTPLALHAQPQDLPHYGLFLVGAQVQTARARDFDHALDGLLTDLAKNGPAADAFNRAKSTAISAEERSRSSNEWWLSTLSGNLTQARIAQLSTRIGDLEVVTPEAVKTAVARHLVQRSGFTIDVLPGSATSP